MNKSNSSTLVRPRIHSAKKNDLSSLIPLSTPLSVHIDVSSVCNFKCSFCFQADDEGMKEANLKRGLMDIALYKKIVDDLKEFPSRVKKIKIGNHGEPTLHPKIVEMVDYAKKSNTAEIIEMFTNGSKLTEEINDGIVKAGLQRINISIEGLSDSDYKLVTGVKQSFQTIVDGVKDLFNKKEKNKSDLIIYVKIADQSHAFDKSSNQKFEMNESDKKFFYDTFSPISDEIFIEKIVPQWPETQLKEQNQLSDTGMYGQRSKKWKNVCPFTFMYLHFNCDGSVSPCTLDWARKVNIGNSQNLSVKEIWNGVKLKQLQISMLQKNRKNINVCGSCSAPMVCVEEDFDEKSEEILKKNYIKEIISKENPWIENNFQSINFKL